MFPVSLDKAGPKHSTSVPFSVGIAVPPRVDEKEVAFVLNPVTGVTVNVSLGPQIVEEVDVCTSRHSLLPPTLQMVILLVSPVTVHLKVKLSPGQVGGAVVNCLPEGKHAKKTSSSGLEMRLYMQPEQGFSGSTSEVSLSIIVVLLLAGSLCLNSCSL